MGREGKGKARDTRNYSANPTLAFHSRTQHARNRDPAETKRLVLMQKGQGKERPCAKSLLNTIVRTFKTEPIGISNIYLESKSTSRCKNNGEIHSTPF